jgi:outer membrane protein TolC
MNRNPALLIALLSCSQLAAGQSLTLDDIIEQAKAQSPLARQAETRKENRYWSFRYYQTNFNPQLRLSGSLPDYSQDFFPVRQPDGTIEFRSRDQTNSTANLGLLQPIPWTGGQVSVNTAYNFFNDLARDESTWNGTLMNVQFNQPVFAFNQLRWDKKTEPLRFEESKREYVEEMEAISRDAVDRFFAVIKAQIDLQIATFNLANNDTIHKIEQGRYNIGTTSQDKLLQVELQLLRSRQDVTRSRIELENARLSLRNYIGVQEGEIGDLILPEGIPFFEATLSEALQFARANRADFIAFERRRYEADREVAQAKGNRFQTNLTASFGLNNSADYFNDLYQDPQRQQRFNVTLSVPVIDWGRNRSMMRTALANKKLNDYVIAQDELVFEQEIMTQVRQFELLRLQIEISKKSDEVALQRFLVAQNRYLIGKIDITDLNIALNEKDAAKRSYLEALRSFWTAYYDLRRLTLYDFVNRRLLYVSDQDS